MRNFIKIPFINKGIDFIDLPSIFKDNTVKSSFPDNFENKEPPITVKWNIFASPNFRENGPKT